MPLIIFIFGTMIGSFISVLIHRIHENKPGILLGRSQCTQCKYKLRPLDLIPLFSYIFTRGKCRSCKKSISLTYPALELMTGFTFLALYLFTPSIFELHEVTYNTGYLHTVLFYYFTFTALIFTFFYDLKYLEISDRILLPLIIIGIILPFTPNYFLEPKDMALGLLIPIAFFAFQIIISKGKWIGGGDLRIGAVMGVLLGWKAVLLALFVGYCIGAVISLLLLTSKKFTRKSMIPFGPFLVIGTYIAFFYGEAIIKWYLELFYI
ncbi:MAG: prepilin peptidase [Candidatus Peregrinibacteria bacterium]|nr:prepilin peptidase [Candidatus Peregrinibacteria bacterium]